VIPIFEESTDDTSDLSDPMFLVIVHTAKHDPQVLLELNFMLAEVLSENLDASAVFLDHIEHGFKRGCLPGAIRADESHDIPGLK
jgi:hypothetical protein